MPDIHDLLVWFTSKNGRLIAAAALFLCMYALKLIPAVEQKLLTTPKRRMIANAFLALGPALWLLSDRSVPVLEVVQTGIEAFLGAMGIHVALKVAKGQSVGSDAAPPQVDTPPSLTIGSETISAIAKAVVDHQELRASTKPPAVPDEDTDPSAGNGAPPSMPEH